MTTISHSRQIKKPLFLYCLIVLFPLLATVILPRFLLDSNLLEFHAGWSDEIVYRQEILTFKETGFQGGYFSVDEQPAKYTGSRFGTHGPAFALLIGGLTRLTGWKEYLFPFINMAFISLSLIGFLYLVRPDRTQTVFILLLVALYYPMLLYIPSLMQESFHHALAIVFAGLLIKVSKLPIISFGLKIVILLILLIAALVRVTWSVLAFPFLFFLITGKKRIILALFLGLGFFVLMILYYFSFTSPYTQGSLQSMLEAPNLIAKLNIILINFSDNLAKFFQWDSMGLELSNLFHYQYLFILLGICLLPTKDRAFTISGGFILLVSLLMTFGLYKVGYFVDYRVLSPLLLFGLLSLVMNVKMNKLSTFFLVLFLLFTVAFLPKFIQNYRSFHVDHFWKNNDPIAQNIGKSLGTIQFMKNASPWCNSILTNHGSYDEMRYLMPGIGINTLLQLNEPNYGVKSHYLFVPKTFLEKVGLTESCTTIYQSESDVFCERTNDDC